MIRFEIKHAVKGLLKTPLFTLSTTVMLGIGLGLVLAGFTIIQSWILRPPPFPQPEQIVHFEIDNTVTGDKGNSIPVHSWIDMRDTQTQLQYFAGYSEGTINVGASGVGDDQRAQRYEGVFATGDLFRVIGIEPLLGRNFAVQDEQQGAPRVVVLSYALWQQRFQGDEGVLGQSIRVNGEDASIIGVMPDGFRFPRNHGIWVNFSTDLSDLARGSGPTLNGIGRLHDGASIASAQGELQALITNEHQQYPDTSHGDWLAAKTLSEEYVNEVTRGVLRTLFITVLMILLVACANVAGLLGARATQRSRAQVIRGALGATRARLLFSGLVEAAVIAGVASILGWFIAHGFTGWFKHTIRSSADGPPLWATEMGFDWQTLLFATGITFLAALVSGWLPAWRAAGMPVGTALRSAGQGSIGNGLGKAGRYLVAVEVAISLMLLVSAGLMVRTVLNIQFITVGADISQVMSGRIGLFETSYPQQQEVRQLLKAAQLDMQALPDAQAATFATSLPMTFGGRYFIANDELADKAIDQLPGAEEVIIADNYFDFFAIPLLAGRAFNSGDMADSNKVVVISHDLAATLWSNTAAISNGESVHNTSLARSVIGKRLRVRTFNEVWEYRTIVGVVGDVVNDGEDLVFGSGPGVAGAYYLPAAQGEARFWSLAVKSRLDNPNDMRDDLRLVIQTLDDDLPVYWLRSMQDWVDINLFDHRLIAKVFSLFGIIALLLTAAGLYALLAFSVNNQTREIGVRRALGASASRIIGNVSRASLKQMALGAVLGLVLAIGFAHLLTSILYEVSPFDPLTFICVLLIFTLVTILASAVPALRATRIQPMEALRYE